uniref:Uncharacterized protein n=1 Tax=Faecalibaculum rodentium TaxID=1702221 RepID=A0A140DXW2_9FIRM|nr:hypothetical protein AALO17_23550 [Faecalibaculum rodentium]
MSYWYIPLNRRTDAAPGAGGPAAFTFPVFRLTSPAAAAISRIPVKTLTARGMPIRSGCLSSVT